MTFGPFKFVERLEKAGLSREQASAIVEAQKDSLSEVLDSTLATQSDLREIRSEGCSDVWMSGGVSPRPTRYQARGVNASVLLTTTLSPFWHST